MRGSGDPEYNTGMMEAVLMGDSARLQKSWTDDYRTTGTFHALVISGTHVALLAGLLIFLLRICFLPKTIAILATVPMAWTLRRDCRMADALHTLGGRHHAVCHRPDLLSPRPRPERAGSRGHGVRVSSIPDSSSTPASSFRSSRWL